MLRVSGRLWHADIPKPKSPKAKSTASKQHSESLPRVLLSDCHVSQLQNTLLEYVGPDPQKRTDPVTYKTAEYDPMVLGYNGMTMYNPNQ